MIALLLPNEGSQILMQEYVVTVDSVERLTGIDFFAELEDSLQKVLESYIDISLWEFKQHRSTSTVIVPAVQCKGIAKSTGIRCRNMTTNENGYCHHHQDQVDGQKIIAPALDRCMAITQAGTQCKRNAEAGSRFCWQHRK